MSNLVGQEITETLEKNYMPYAMSVIISRAIPEIDGFKPAHRKLLYTMYKQGLLTGNRTKSANVVGETMKYNPHGDMAIYETLVRLTEGCESLLHPFVDSKGNFGKQYSRDMSFAASRYTEVKLSPICAEIFKNIDKNTVDMVDNYDGTKKEPTLLPTAFPNVLVNPNQGIAVGMASNICSFNLCEVCDATVMYMENPDADLKEVLFAPDFSTGGLLLNDKEALNQIYETGRGSVRVRSKYVYDKKSSLIEITEIPYSTTIEAIIDKLAELIKANKIKEINDVRDETDRKGLKIAIDLKRGVDADKLMAKLFKLTPLEDTFSCNFNILINDEPRVMGIKEIIKNWVDFRIGCIRRQMIFDADRKEERLHLLCGLEKILLDIDKAIEIVRNTPDDSLVVPNLMKGFGIDQIQAEFVAEIKLRNLNKDYILKRLDEISSLTEDIKNLRDISKSNKKICKVIKSELLEIKKKYGKDRKTVIIEPDDSFTPDVKEEIEDYNVKVFLSRDNYFKKITLVSLRSSSEQKLKEGDEIIGTFDASNRDDMLFFSDRQNCYKMRLDDISDTKASALGDFLPNLLDMEEGEKIVYCCPSNEYKGFLLFAYQNGKVAKIDMKSFETKTNRKRLTSSYSSVSPLAGVLYIESECLVALFTDIDKCLCFDTSKILTKSSRSSQGVAVFTLRKKSRLVSIKPGSALSNPGNYITKNIPGSGYYLKDEDSSKQQLSLFD